MSYPHGLFSWADVSAPDPTSASKFYAELFSWKADDQHDPEGAYIYTMFRQDGEDVAGLGPQGPDTPEGTPAIWNSYITVDDVEATIEAWTSAGGSVVMPPMDVMTSGRMAIVADPEGAVVALWQAEDHVGAGLFGVPNSMSWNELATRDSAAARDFYEKALGWSFDEADSSPSEYWTIRLDSKEAGNSYAEDHFNGGIITMTEEWGDMPAHWMVYFTVADTDATAEKVKDLGGMVPVPPFDTDAGRIAVVNDPQGGTFSIISPPDQQ